LTDYGKGGDRYAYFGRKDSPEGLETLMKGCSCREDVVNQEYVPENPVRNMRLEGTLHVPRLPFN
jgi:hypothetical protein